MTSSPGPGDRHFSVTTLYDDTSLRLVLRGEADVTTLDDLRSALSGIVLDGQRLVELDVSDLEFVDVAVMRQLTLFATDLKESGRDVRTRGARPVVAHLIQLFGVHDRLGLDERPPRDAS